MTDKKEREETLASLVSAVQNALKNKGLKFDFDSENYVFTLIFGGDGDPIKVVLFCGPGYLTLLASGADETQFSVTKELLSFINDLSQRTPIGNWELHDYRGVVFKWGVRVPPIPADSYVMEMVLSSVARVESALPEIRQQGRLKKQ